MEPWLIRIADYLLTQSWQIAVLTLAVALATFALRNRSAHVRYLLWLIVLAKALVPPLYSVPLAVLPEEQPPMVLSIPPVVERGAAEYRIPEPAVTESPRRVAPELQAVSSPVVPMKPAQYETRAWLAIGWLVGAAALAFYYLANALRTQLWLQKRRKALPGESARDIENFFTTHGVRSVPRIWLLERINQPFVWGLVRGSIYLPAKLLDGKNVKFQPSLLGHELSHVIRLDAMVNSLQVVAQTVFWFHPFVWWANAKIRAEREKCCDEMTIARLNAPPEEYSEAIVETLATKYEQARPIPSLAVAGQVKNIEERIKTMLKPGKKFHKRPTLASAIVASVIALLTVPTAFVLAARAEAKPTAEQKAEPAKSLRRAAYDGDIEQVKSLISKGADVNEKGRWGITPLHLASREGHAEVARLLISKGAYLNSVSENAPGLNEMTPLHCAAASGNKQTVELLLSEGAEINARNGGGMTPLFEAMKSSAAGRKEIVELVVAKGAKVPALHLAAYVGDIEKVRKCLQDGIDINSQENFCCTALHAAANGGKKDVVEFLINRGANIDARDTSGMTPLYYTAIHNCEDIADLLLSKGADVNAKDESGFALLHYAVFCEDSKDAVKLLIGKGANVNIKDDDGSTPLVWAVWWSDKDMVELLISKGADLKQEDNYGYAALYWAAVQGSEDLVELLVAKGAAPISAIYLAVCTGDLAKVKRLVEEGADVNTRAKGSGGGTPLFAAVFGDNNDIAKFLIAKGADVNAKDKAGVTPLHYACEHGKRNMAELLINEGADVNAIDGGGSTPLHRMFYIGRARMDVAELLIAKGANVNARLTGDGWLTRLTPLHLSVESGHTKIVGLLINKGADINTPKSDGETPLHIACKCGHKDVVELLISKGAVINAKDKKGQTALSLAREQGRDQIVELLKKYGAKE